MNDGRILGYYAAMPRRHKWSDYYERIAGRPPRPTLLAALEHFGAHRTGDAVDLGCGDGRDTVELLRRGWRVLAIDAEPEALERLAARPDLPAGAQLETLCAHFEDATWPVTDLVNASFALPLCPPARFPAVWEKLVRLLRPGGRFSGQLFGPRDSWFDDPDITFHTRAEAERLLAGFAAELFNEEESDTVTPQGEAKHWHLFHIVARKPA